MQRTHRLNHLRIWLLLGVLVPLGLSLAIWLRPAQPIEAQQPALLSTGTGEAQ